MEKHVQIQIKLEKLHTQLPNSISPIQRDELFNLHHHYDSVVKDELDFFFKYMNFYTGILSALIAGTLTGLLSLKPLSSLGLILLLGPGLVFSISYIGYKNVKVYYRRYLEAWVTVINIKTMLGLRKAAVHSPDILPPAYPSRHGGGFITQFKRIPIQKLFDKLEADRATAEVVLEKLLLHGDTLKFAKYTFRVFIIGAFILVFAIICLCWH